MHKTSRLFKTVLLTFGILFVSFATVSGQSFWIDEANSAAKAIQPTLSAFWAKNLQIAGSDLQMPFYMFLLWVWEKIAGSSEYILRSLNIVFFLAACLVVSHGWKGSIQSRLLLLLSFCISPMLWIYMDEARPYIMQFFGATLVLVALLNTKCQLDDHLGKNLLMMCAGLFILCGASLTGVVFSFWWALAYAYQLLRHKAFGKVFASWRLFCLVLVFSLLMLSLGGFYLWTLLQGTGASPIASTSILTLCFSLYELFGAMGWGPDRLTLRADEMVALQRHMLGLFLFVTSSLCFWVYGLYRLSRSRLCSSESSVSEHGVSTDLLFLLTAVAGLLCMVGVGVFWGMRTLGRHLMPLLPTILYFTSSILAEAFYTEKKKRLFSFVCVIYCLVMAFSCLSFRFSGRYTKDDYRTAISIAKKTIQDGDTIWWAADTAATEYYRLAVEAPRDVSETKNEFKKGCWVVPNLSSTTLAAQPAPAVIILSKEDVYDIHGAIRQYIADNHYELVDRRPAFSFYAISP